MRDNRPSNSYVSTAVIIAMVAGFVVGFIIGFANSAQAQEGPSCWPHSRVVTELAAKYGEKVVGRGLTDETFPRMFEVFASKNGSWTVMVVSSAGVACKVASGTDWEIISSPRDAILLRTGG